MNKIKQRLARLKIHWLEFQLAYLKRRVGTIVDVTRTTSGVNCFYMGLNFKHKKYAKLKEVQEQLEERTVWQVPFDYKED